MFYIWRIQTEENSQDTPDGSNINLFAGIYHTIVTLSEEENSGCIDCKIYKPLVLQEKAQHWKQKQEQKNKNTIKMRISIKFPCSVICCKPPAGLNSQSWASSNIYSCTTLLMWTKKYLFYRERQWRWLVLSPGEGQCLWAQWAAYSPHSAAYEQIKDGGGKKITMQAWSMKKRMDEKHTITLSWSNTRITWYNFITSCQSTQWSCSMKHSPPFPTCLSCFVWASAFLPGHTALPLKGVWIATNWNKQQAHVLKQFSALCE